MGSAGAGMMVVGSAINTYGKLKELEGRRQTALEKERALYLQAEMVSQLNERKLKLLGKSQKTFTANKISMFAKAGVSLEGSALQSVSDDQSEMANERNITQMQGEYDVARLRRAAYLSGQESQGYRESMLLTGISGALGMGGAAINGSSGGGETTTADTSSSTSGYTGYGSSGGSYSSAEGVA